MVKSILKFTLELILLLSAFVVLYYGIWFLCLIDDVCYANNFVELV